MNLDKLNTMIKGKIEFCTSHTRMVSVLPNLSLSAQVTKLLFCFKFQYQFWSQTQTNISSAQDCSQNTVGSLNWVYTKCALNKAEADVHEADIQGSTGEKTETEAASTDQWSLYNCVLYGLPHLTPVAQATA